MKNAPESRVTSGLNPGWQLPIEHGYTGPRLEKHRVFRGLKVLYFTGSCLPAFR
jgi:hypothetical protein